MLFTVIKKNSYQDSVNLMLLTTKLSELEGVNKISVMMGTPANIDIFKNTGLYTEDLEEASANDICIVVDTEDELIVDKVLEEIDLFLNNQSIAKKGKKLPSSRTFEGALSKMPDANMSLISVNGEFAAEETEKALDKGLNVFLFSDNMPIEDEVRLKKMAQEKGLLVMGPDCGTSILGGVPVGFANVLKGGNIGIVGASGTGIQEISTIISRNGGGISQAIGTGGRDLSSEVGGITASTALKILESDEETDIIVFVSKPPAKDVMEKIEKQFKGINKPIVAMFLGEDREDIEENIHFASTLEGAALKALDLSKEVSIFKKISSAVDNISKNKNQVAIKGLYCGGTLAGEAANIIAKHYNMKTDSTHDKGVMLNCGGHKIIDLGDDFYTKTKPHPMIDPSTRVEVLKDIVKEEDTAIVLLDNVIGYASNEKMASILSKTVKEAKEILLKEGKEVVFIASVTGTMEDPQNYSNEVETLKEAGILVFESNASAVRESINILEKIKECKCFVSSSTNEGIEKAYSLVKEGPRVINTGLEMFTESLTKNDASVVQYNWAPIASGDKRMAKILKLLKLK